MTTSRIGRKPIAVPSGVEIKLNSGELSIKGPKGHTMVSVHPFINLIIENKEIKVHANSESSMQITGASNKLYRSITGTTRANINNSIHGVTHGFERKLTLVGVGYKAQMKGKVLSLNLGYSHDTDFKIPEGITIETPSPTEIIIKGINKQDVGRTAAKIREIRPPEPYKGKGVRYSDEIIEIKETKKK